MDVCAIDEDAAVRPYAAAEESERGSLNELLLPTLQSYGAAVLDPGPVLGKHAR